MASKQESGKTSITKMAMWQSKW